MQLNLEKKQLKEKMQSIEDEKNNNENKNKKENGMIILMKRTNMVKMLI